MKRMCLTLIGNICFPEDFEQIFTSNGEFLITRALGDDWCFEMSGESMFYALCEQEKIENLSLLHYKSKIVDAIVKRMAFGNGKLLHKSFTGGYDSQFRSTNSALRTLLYASNQGFNTDNDIKTLANYQFKYYFSWKKGIWFCHDESEFDGKIPFSHIGSRVAGKSSRNTLTLNTHIDSLNTLLLLKKHGKENLLDFDLNQFIDLGIVSVNQLLELSYKSSVVNALQKFDYRFLNFFLKKSKQPLLSMITFYEKILHPIIFKFTIPTVFFNNGFIARDLSVLNRHIDYQLVNIVDFARLLNLYKQIGESTLFPCGVLRFDELMIKLHQAISFVEDNTFLLGTIQSSELQTAWYAEMYYAMSALDLKYAEKAKNLYLEQLYCSESPFYKLNFLDEEK